MADLIKLKTGTIAKLEGKNANGTPTVALDKGSIYFAVDTSNHLGKIVYDAPVGTNGVDRIVMSTRAEYADEANIAQNVEGVVAINHGGTGATTATGARSNLELGNAKIFYGTCDTAAGTTEKAVTCTEFTSGDLVKGAVVFVAFTNTNSGAVANLTLNVNGTGAKPIKKYYNNGINNLTSAAELIANSIIPFVYIGTHWVAFGLDYNNTYSSMSQAEANTGTATTGRIITAKVLTDTIANRIADALSDTNAMIYKGLIGATADIPNNHQAGWVFKVSTAGTYVGENCEVGDLIICIVDGTTANNDDWMVVQKNIDKALYKSSNTFTNEHMLLADGTDGKVKSVAINPTLTLTAGTSEVGPKFKISVGGKTSSESTLGTANASTYGVTKLTNTVDASQESLAATPKLVSAAVTNGINALDVSDTADSTKYVSAVSEANGKISVSRASFSPSITVTAGDASNAPKINVTVAGNSGTAQSIGTATTAVYGATKLSNDSSSTEESLAATPKGVWTAINTLDGAITGTPSASKTVTAFSQTNGKVSATFGNISIGAGQITSGTLAVANGGTGQTSIANIKAGKDGAGNTITTTYATKAEVNDLLAATDAMIFKTVIGAAADFPSPPYDAGWTYKIGAFGTYAGKICEVGDLLICVKDRAEGETGSDDDWMVVQTNLDNGLFKGTNVFADGQMLLADSTVGKVKAVNIGPEIDMTAGTANEAPKFTITVGGVESNSASIGTANTSVYGATKLSDAVNSNSTSLAATANAVKKAYDLAASKTSNVGTITGVTAGAGLTGGGTSGNVTIGHSNSITAITTEGLYKIKYDAQGHITGALLQNVTDNTSNADVSNSDTNLITGRTLYYQLAKKGYTTNTGTVKSVATGGGLTGGTITTTGTISHAVPENASNGIKGGTGRTYLQSITTDAYGHVTGYTTASETVTNTDTKVNVVARGTTKAYLLADTTAPTNTAVAHTAVAETGVYLDTTAGKLVASSFSGSGAGLTSLNASNISSGTLAKERLATSGVTAGTYQGITVDAYGRVTGAVNHTYPTSLATDTGTAAITLASAGTYKLTAGGTSVIFKMPTSNNYSHPTGDGNLHIPATGTNSGGKFLKAGSTAGAISWATLTKADISDFPTSLAPTSHSHGNIANGGTISSTGVAIANGDYLLISDASNSGKIERTSITFDGSTATKALTQKGTWETFNNYTHPTATAHNSGLYKVTVDALGHVTAATAVTKADITGLGIPGSDTDTKNTAGSTNSDSKLFLIGATSQAASATTYSDSEVYTTNGTLSAKILSTSAGVHTNTANSGTAGGVSLYSTDPNAYGVTMRQTGTSSGQLGKHGFMQGDWATYFTFSGAVNRGWVFRHAGANVASINGEGKAVFNGSVTVGGNAANNSGVRMEYNSTTKSLDFIFA